ncbi:MAG TPA: 16S rRNA (uracil(1498)-N(3))-methyltransferase [Burkholderiales bacterium]|jgi:16S rRNA (uracil1498-N3)-methyltransferase|nr:16S rRNA (uracil(1498)-N(3))-methyltransferase [Burkholderiales bacterium]
MPRFYLDSALRAGTSVLLPEDSAHHAVHVLRVQAGEEVTLFNGRGGEFAARIASIQRLKVLVDVLAHQGIERESPLRVVLVQGVSAGERMDFTVRKSVELGVAEIQPVLAASSVARPKGERAAARQAHWQKIAIAACEQCGRNQIPTVHPTFAASDYRGGIGTKLLLSPASELRFSQAVKSGGSEFTIAAGPEAGFNATEESAFLNAGFVPVRLGARVLRTETAGIAALAALSALLGDF